jgi:hypothetical protein
MRPFRARSPGTNAWQSELRVVLAYPSSTTIDAAKR